MKRFVKKIIPKSILNIRHLVYAFFGALRYRNPSDEMFVIGVTGTSGKSTTILLLRHFLEAAGYTVGSLSTVDFYVAGETKLNDQKMTMLGRAKIQQYLRSMVEHGCDIAIVEATSEGAVQHRHRFINFDTIVLTNFYPEHIESHGSFENYKEAKKSIFEYVASCKPKYRLGRYEKMVLCDSRTCVEPFQKIPKTAIVNANVAQAEEFLDYSFFVRVLFGEKEKKWHGKSGSYGDIDTSYVLDDISMTRDGIAFTIDDHPISTSMFGQHNAINITAAVATLRTLGVEWSVIQEAARNIPKIPGRIEFIQEAGKYGITAIVDYAFEPVALKGLYAVVDLLRPKKVIHVLGSTGGGRDASKRPTMGAIAAERADIVIVTDEDPYDEDPIRIMEMVASGAEAAGAERDKNLYIIPDRQEAITRALSIAQEGDLVLVTGKGSEQAMCLANGKMIPWDDREAVRKGLRRRA